MQLTKFTDYSLKCLVYLTHEENEFISIKTISEHYNISYEHLTKIIHNLSVLGYIESKKGKNGGVKLANNAIKLRIGDLIKTLEPNMNLVECFNHETNTCKIINTCRLKHYLWGANKAFFDYLNQYTLKDAKF